ncbi:uncharacterized protein LOC106083038 [Stomoxys calcitrans]|uniref:Uncharacterized protein n=1 Tax=Stomoxys calcitrans TaxID=35570 RepID=A0A1I8PVU8_STOCA|nr:uncharacterized protein LOC106083038 [Stomoxys calcitrans]
MCDPSCLSCGPCNPCDPCCGPYECKPCQANVLRGGVMYNTCDCLRRNGLQDKCPSAWCQRRSDRSSFSQSNNSCPQPSTSPYGEYFDPSCGPSNPSGGAPSPVPWSPSPSCCSPLPEGGIPDPRIWNVYNTPPSYPCGF